MTKREADFTGMETLVGFEPQLSSNWPPEPRKRKKRSRWGGDDSEKAFIPGMPTAVPMGMTKEQEEQYLAAGT